jgi:hypothetical protein
MEPRPLKASIEIGQRRLAVVRERVVADVVGHDPLDPDALTGEPGGRGAHEAGAGRCALVGEDIEIGDRFMSSIAWWT